MDDRELLELAAKATGHTLGSGYYTIYWNPLTDDGDALRLAVKLRLDICRPTKGYPATCVWVDYLSEFIEEAEGNDPYAATRRAIVRAAAAIAAGAEGKP